MKEKYMDDMRHVEEIERWEAQEDGHREFKLQRDNYSKPVEYVNNYSAKV